MVAILCMPSSFSDKLKVTVCEEVEMRKNERPDEVAKVKVGPSTPLIVVVEPPEAVEFIVTVPVAELRVMLVPATKASTPLFAMLSPSKTIPELAVAFVREEKSSVPFQKGVKVCISPAEVMRK